MHRVTNTLSSYEGLPPNFSLLQNMTAGAFAGIAVSLAWHESKDHYGSGHCMLIGT